ncbi:Histone deacetylase complex subunit SAP30-like protein [Armadillidium nasatum]|uniref:Histone deacetylase complex subunit SAP30-like protein n=1 Tax=Armadillidium nasatum TaxID=96803 RepID=A0A5N5SSS0_9CRUS|nr:Histone deacetylase complex subunit SAP30-like protein [Armadillidium nasatum]
MVWEMKRIPRIDKIRYVALVDGGERCSRLAGNAAYNKRIQRLVSQRKLRLHSDSSASHSYICEHHKSVIQSVRVKRKRRESEEDSGDIEEPPEAELFNLQVNTLRRYKRHYKISTNPGLNKAQLVDIIMKHFHSIPVDEKECLTYFIYMVKTNNSKFDQRNGSNMDM